MTTSTMRTTRTQRCWLGAAAVLLACSLAPQALAQTRADLPEFLFDPTYYSSRIFEKKAVMDGNEIALTFFNYGLLGGVGEIRGNWPKGTNDFYIGDVLPVVAAEVPVDSDGDGVADTLILNTVTTRGPRAGADGPPGQSSIFWGFEAKPGFAADQFTDPDCEDISPNSGGLNDSPAMSDDPCTWPTFWPDQPTWLDPATGEADWNGFFGRDQFQADLETYFWMDDQNDREIVDPQGFGFPNFQADSLRPGRGGMGLEVKVRGLQWSQFLAEDAIFWLYEVTNTSTTTYPRVAVGLTVGTLAGGDGDSNDDLAFFDQGNRIVYSWDDDNSGNEGQDVGYVGYGFLESPGDANNGIDDDGDGDPGTEAGQDIDGLPYVTFGAGVGNNFEAEDFEPRVLAEGDPLILIDDETGERSIVYVGNEQTTVVSQGRSYTVGPGTILEESEILIEGQIESIVATEKNLLDEDLDGLIDEDINLHFERRFQELDGSIQTLPPVKFKDYVGFAEAIRDRAPTSNDSLQFGLLNPMIDERRDDGVDNDGDWNANSDDVGADGLAGTGDAGEGDGVASPGEPNFDGLDVTESDQVGLSSFFYFTPPGALRMNDDQRLWEAMSPGFFTTNEELEQQQAGGGVDGDFIFSSGYFRLEPGQTLRFSLATVFGDDLADITANTETIQEIYDRNYQFARPPLPPPNLTAVPGNGKVTLFWDGEAVDSVDPVLGKDFEGFRVYKSTDPFFRDPDVITDGTGSDALIAPFAQYDLDNGLDGFWPTYTEPFYPEGSTAADSVRIQQDYIETIQNLLERTRATPYFIGNDTGLRFSVTDTTVNNGQRYYYAVTAYDRGSPDFYPAENNIPISVLPDGSVVTGPNVAEVIPNAPVAGYENARIEGGVVQVSGNATGEVFAEILDARQIREGQTYTLEFYSGGAEADSFRVFAGSEVIARDAVGREEAAAFDGIRFLFRNEELEINRDSTGFEDPEGLIETFVGRININEAIPGQTWIFQGQLVPYDYEIRFSDDLVGQSIGGFRLGSGNAAPEAVAKQTNFTVYNLTLDRPSPFAFREPSAASRNGRFDDYEFIFIYEDLDDDPKTDLTPTYILRPTRTSPVGEFPDEGDVFTLATRKPFASGDRYTISTAAASVDGESAEDQLERIRVVPNPYVAAASWERPLPPTITSGRGERRVDFINLPQESTVRVYNVRGALIWEGRHDGGISDGTLSWNLRTRENLDVAYGVYFYHVEAPGVGEKTGKLALIK